MDKVRLGLCLAFVMALATAPDSAMAASLPAWNGANALEHGGRGGRAVRPGMGVGAGVVAGCNIYGQNKLSSVSILVSLNLRSKLVIMQHRATSLGLLNLLNHGHP